MSAYDEPLDRFTIPRPRVSDLFSEISNFGDAVQCYGSRFDESPFFGKRVNRFVRESFEIFRGFVQAVEM